MDVAELLNQIRQAQVEILQTMPYRDFGLDGHKGASDTAVRVAEQRLGRALPPSYREFLRICDGWPRFYDGATLLGTASLGRRMYDDLARAAFEAAETPEPDLGPPSRFKPKVLIPFGIDMQATTLFVFNPAAVSESGEYEVIAWMNEIGVRRSSFASFLEMVLELCHAELESAVQASYAF
ncbi:MAG: SMI1/KNR4 family protein [Polyangiaceae bacterium]